MVVNVHRKATGTDTNVLSVSIHFITIHKRVNAQYVH